MMLALAIVAFTGQHAWQETRDPPFSGDFGELAMHNATSCMLFGDAQTGAWDYARDVGDACINVTNDLEIKSSLYVRIDTGTLTVNAAPGSQYDGSINNGGVTTSVGNFIFADYQNKGLKIMVDPFWGSWLIITEASDRNSTSYTKPTPTGSGVPFVISDTSTSSNFLWFQHSGSNGIITSVGATKFDSPYAYSDVWIEDCSVPTHQVYTEFATSPLFLLNTSGGATDVELSTIGTGANVIEDGTEVIFVINASDPATFNERGLVQQILAGSSVTVDQYDTAVFTYIGALDLWVYSGGSDN